MRLLVIGAGAIGSYVGGHLAAAGHGVTFLARGATAEALAERGLVLTAAPGAAPAAVPIEVIASLNDALGRGTMTPDSLLLATKAYDTASVIEQLRAVTHAPPPILCLQNGVDGEAELSAAFGSERVIAGTVTTPVSVPTPGQVVVEKVRGMGVALGHPASAPLVEALNASGIQTRAYQSAGSMKWSKLLTNLLGNATSAITGWPVAAVFADPRLFAIEAASIREARAVMKAYGYGVVDLPGVPVRLLAWAVTRLPPVLARPLLARAIGGGRGSKRPSLHQDVDSGRRQSEVRWLHGAVARHAARQGLSAPINALLAETVEALSSGKLDRDELRAKPDGLIRQLMGMV